MIKTIISNEPEVNNSSAKSKTNDNYENRARSQNINNTMGVYVDIRTRPKESATMDIDMIHLNNTQYYDSSTLERASQGLKNRARRRNYKTSYQNFRDCKYAPQSKKIAKSMRKVNLHHAKNTRKDCFMVVNSMKKMTDYMPSSQICFNKQHNKS